MDTKRAPLRADSFWSSETLLLSIEPPKYHQLYLSLSEIPCPHTDSTGPTSAAEKTGDSWRASPRPKAHSPERGRMEPSQLGKAPYSPLMSCHTERSKCLAYPAPPCSLRKLRDLCLFSCCFFTNSSKGPMTADAPSTPSLTG